MMVERKSPRRAKIGKCWYVVGYNGKPIIGLSWDKTNGYYFPTHYKQTEEYAKTGKRPHFTKNYDTSIMMFEAWKNKHNEEKYSIWREKVTKGLELVHQDPGPDYYIERGEPEPEYYDTIYAQTYEIPESFIIQKSKELFAKYPPSIIAEKFGMPSLAKIDYVDDLAQPINISELLPAYLNQAKFKHNHLNKQQKLELHKIKQSWERFINIANVPTVQDLNKDILMKFYNDIYREYIKENKSTTWINGYFERIKRVFNYGMEFFDHTSDLQNCINRIKSVLKAEKNIIKNPAKLITKLDFHRLINASPIEEKAMYNTPQKLGAEMR